MKCPICDREHDGPAHGWCDSCARVFADKCDQHGNRYAAEWAAKRARAQVAAQVIGPLAETLKRVAVRMSGGVNILTDDEIAEAYDCLEAGTRVRTRLVRGAVSIASA